MSSISSIRHLKIIPIFKLQSEIFSYSIYIYIYIISPVYPKFSPTISAELCPHLDGARDISELQVHGWGPGFLASEVQYGGHFYQIT